MRLTILSISSILIAAMTIASTGTKIDDVTSTKKIASKNDRAATRATITSDNHHNGSVVTESQETMCSVKIEDVVAKAQSTASRALIGVCTSDELTRSLKSLENTLMTRLGLIQENLTNMIEAALGRRDVSLKKIADNQRSSPFRTVAYLFEGNVFKNRT